MNILGVDPGITGGLALYDGKELMVWQMPFFEIVVNGKIRKRIDVVGLHTIIATNEIDHAYIEKVNAQPGNGAAAAFAFGYGCGVIDSVVQCTAIPFTHVSSMKWKKAMDCPKEKDGSRQRASQLLPAYADCWGLKRQDGIAEAALIALYGWKKEHENKC